ncbi:MAG: glycosyltransferase [Pseudomonadota bacterium]|nr:glycosyltransferase [Pseudomonadota bacterium]
MLTLAWLLLILLALVAVPMAAYLALLTVLSGRCAPPAQAAATPNFAVVVPAHDEAAGIAAAIASLRALAWPQHAVRVVVVADNCSDDTAAIARDAGAQVIERHDDRLRGKGYALAFAFEHLLAEGWAQALVVIDADSEVDAHLLQALAARLAVGAEAIQTHYGVTNANAAWRTRLMAIALGAFHRLRSRARERLGLSCGIRGNGWCVTPQALQRVPYRAFSLAEDAEFGIDLGLAGLRVHYVDEAEVRAEMVTGEAAARSQRQRWEHGRGGLIRSRLPRLLKASCSPARRVPLDLACDLLVLPLSSLVLASMLLLGLGGALTTAGADRLALLPGLFCLLAATLYVLRGWQLSGVGARGAFDLAGAPVYIAWKLLLKLRPHAADKWVRTTREQR